MFSIPLSERASILFIFIKFGREDKMTRRKGAQLPASMPSLLDHLQQR
jgi:hypothetical protein